MKRARRGAAIDGNASSLEAVGAQGALFVLPIIALGGYSLLLTVPTIALIKGREDLRERHRLLHSEYRPPGSVCLAGEIGCRARESCSVTFAERGKTILGDVRIGRRRAIGSPCVQPTALSIVVGNPPIPLAPRP